jgi:prepilin-type N-terminal cleavage/methylation domain-containing protein
MKYITRALSAFTLSEVLISLSILGLISALTLPGVYNTVNKTRNEAIFKETYNALQTVVRNGIDNGIDGTTMPNYLRDNLSYTRYSATDLTEGWVFPNYKAGGFMLANGAVVNFYNEPTPFFFVDLNGTAGPNTHISTTENPADRIDICFYWSNASYLGFPRGLTRAPKIGEIMPSWSEAITTFNLYMDS